MIDNQMRCLCLSITVAFLLPSSIQPCHPPGSCLVREFPHLVSSEFQDILSQRRPSYKDSILTTMTSSRQPSPVDSPPPLELAPHNAFNGRAFSYEFCFPGQCQWSVPVCLPSSPTLAHKCLLGNSSRRSSWGRSRRTFMACTECRRRQVKVSFSCPSVALNTYRPRSPRTIVSFSVLLPIPLARLANDAQSARSNASSCPSRNKSSFLHPRAISLPPPSPCTFRSTSVVLPVRCPPVLFWVTLPMCVRGCSAFLQAALLCTLPVCRYQQPHRRSATSK